MIGHTPKPRFVFSMSLTKGVSREIEEAGRTGGWWRVEGDELPLPVWVRVGVASDSSLVCTGFAIGVERDQRPPVTASALRVPLASIIERLARDRGVGRGRRSLAQFFDMAAQAPPPTMARTRAGARGHPDEHYERIAAEYRDALKVHPSAPTKTLIAKYPNWDQATVRYWLRVARRRGFLGKADQGRPGEATKGRAERGKKRKRY